MIEGVSVNFEGNELLLLPQKALWWAAESMLLIADVHLGKGDIFRRHGLAIPSGSSAADLEQIGRLIERWYPLRLAILGDLVHGEPGEQLVTEFSRWRERFDDTRMILVTGNHDRHMENVPADWRLEVSDVTRCGNLALLHQPSSHCTTAEIVGHIHPAIRMRAGRADSLRAPAFWLQPRRLVLPSFGSFTGGQSISPAHGDRVFAVGPGQVIEIHGGG